MKPEDIKVGGIYEWRKGFNWRLKSNAANPHLDEAGPFLVISITDEVWTPPPEETAAAAVNYTRLDLVSPSGRKLEWEISIARCMQPLE